MKEKKLKILEVAIVKTKSESVKARADIHFDGFWLKGFKIIQDRKTLQEYVTPPSYLSDKGWRELFRTDGAKDWHEIQRRVLKEYEELQMKESVDEPLSKKSDVPF